MYNSDNNWCMMPNDDRCQMVGAQYYLDGNVCIRSFMSPTSTATCNTETGATVPEVTAYRGFDPYDFTLAENTAGIDTPQAK